MQRVLYFFTATLLLLACQENRESQSENASRFKQVGAEIPLETGLRWIELYQSKPSESARSLSTNFSASAEAINSMVGSVNTLVGVAFHHAIDESGLPHILAIPIDESSALWLSASSRIVIDLNSGEAISEQDAKNWTTRFSETHPDDVWFHFFGAHVFDAINEIPYFRKLDVEPAIKDTDMSPQLLLMIWDETSSTAGRAQAASGTVYDASNPCPPCPVQ